MRVADLEGVKSRRLLAGRHVESGEIRQLFAACGSDPAGARDAAMLALLYGGGLRRSEAVALQLADYDATAGTPTVRHGKGDAARQVYATNGGKDARAKGCFGHQDYRRGGSASTRFDHPAPDHAQYPPRCPPRCPQTDRQPHRTHHQVVVSVRANSANTQPAAATGAPPTRAARQTGAAFAPGTQARQRKHAPRGPRPRQAMRVEHE